MSDAASSYRILHMDALTGALNSFEDFDAWSDDEAIGRALDAAGEQRVELWHNGRKLAAISGGNGPTEFSIAASND